ncbi:MAG: hypothetical protein ACI9B9_000555 [Halioglobus sp.]|jgi:hypothetical protein
MNNTPDSQDGVLAARFKQMRQADYTVVPALPTQQQLDTLSPVATASGFSGAPWKMAAAASVVAVTTVAIMLNQTVSEDPAVLYASIMNTNAMITDSLMRVSDGTLPETGSLQSAFDIGRSLVGTVQ